MTQMRIPQRHPHALAPERAAVASPSHALSSYASPSYPIAESEFSAFIHPQADKRSYLVFKRTLDLTLALTCLILLSPLFAAIAFAIKLDSPGSVLFCQPRVGKNGRVFGCYKFRSMRTDAEKLLAELQHLNERNGPVFKITRDPRVTRLGRFLRKYSLDEFPQLINVIRGEMSLVGPRPPLPSEVATYQPHYFRRLEVTPGITGLWQINGRDVSDFEQWVRFDVQYIDSRCALLDLKILLSTPKAVISGKGAC